MAWPKTLAGLPRASAISKPHDYKQNVPKMKGLVKNELWRGTVWNFQTKQSKTTVIVRRTKEKNHRPWRQNLNMNQVARKKYNEAKLKKSFRIKLLELCKTRTKKSSLDLFNFLFTRLVKTWPMTLAGLPRAGAVSKPLDYNQNVQKWKAFWKMSFNGEQFENFKPKKTKEFNHLTENKTEEPQDPESKNWTWTM